MSDVRDAFKEWVRDYSTDDAGYSYQCYWAFTSAWDTQQERIDELEEKVKMLTVSTDD